MSLAPEQKADSSVWFKIGIFVVGVWVLGHVLPPHPGVRMLAFVLALMVFSKSLEKK